MSLRQRLTKLEERTLEERPIVVWVNSGETQEESRKKVGAKENETFIFVRWLS
jgi:hypothetical protein